MRRSSILLERPRTSFSICTERFGAWILEQVCMVAREGLVKYKYEINMSTGICLTLHNRVLTERLMLLSLSKASEAGRRRDALSALKPVHLT